MPLPMVVDRSRNCRSSALMVAPRSRTRSMMAMPSSMDLVARLIKLLLVDQSLHFTTARRRSTAAAIAAERVAGGRRDAHHASSRLSRSGLIVTEITTAAAPPRLRVVLVARAIAVSILMLSYIYIYICARLSMFILTVGYIAGVLMSEVNAQHSSTSDARSLVSMADAQLTCASGRPRGEHRRRHAHHPVAADDDFLVA